jgi:transglutaminase-like putative cysteine protease
LLIEAARSFGIAARFASGYLAPPLDDFEASSHGSTHAWAQAYLPGAGWVDFDPTNGGVGAAGLITVAVVRDPRQALPLYGVYTGFASDSLGMEVEVSVTPEASGVFSPRRRQITRPDGSNKAAAALRA